MKNLTILHFLILPLIFFPTGEFISFAEGGKRRVHIPDDLDDVVDDEEDEAWKQWGKKSTPSADESDQPPPDLSKMSLPEVQELMMKQNSGPAFGFVKLRLGVRRTRDVVAEIARKWNKVLKTGAMEVKFMPMDLSTIMLNMEKGRDIVELKEFILNEPEAYEIKIGDQVYRRDGDPPLEEVIKKLHSVNDKEDSTNPTKNDGHLKEEL